MSSSSSTRWFFDLLPSVAGALFGSLLTIGIFLVLQVVSGSTATSAQESLSLGQFSLFLLTFISAVGSNLCAVGFTILANRDEYQSMTRPILTHIFVFHIVFFGVLAPFFLFGSVEQGLRLSNFVIPYMACGSIFFMITATQLFAVTAITYQVLVMIFVVQVFFSTISPYLFPLELSLFFAPSIAWFLGQGARLLTLAGIPYLYQLLQRLNISDSDDDNSNESNNVHDAL